MKKFILLITLTITVFCVSAQVDNTGLEHRMNLDTARTGSLYLDIYNYNYMRNYEYFNRFADGLTYFGFNITPTLTYYSSDHLAVNGGLFLRKDFGNNGLKDIQPVFSINYHKDNWQLINGTLQGNIHHRLPEPMYNYDRIIYEPLEYGTQFIFDHRKVFFDAWINWENMIYKVSGEQEKISGGISSELKLINNEKFDLSVPLQFIAFHQGGQIDTLNVPLQTIVNTAFGVNAKYKFTGFLENIHAQAYYLTYKDFSFTKLRPFLQGNGIMLDAGFKLKPFDLSATYWKGSGYSSIHGAPIYRSESSQINNVGYVDGERELLFIRLISNYYISENFFISMRLEPYLDLNDPQFEFSNSLFLVYKEDFRLKKKKTNGQ
jgi:hypothetical protein